MKLRKVEKFDMLEEVYEYLHDYGFSAVDLDKIEKNNSLIFYANVSDVRKMLIFLEEKYLDSDEIIEVVNRNPFLLTVKSNKLEDLDNIYLGILGIDYESMIELIKNNPETYTVSSVELQAIIDYMREKGYTIDIIRQFLLKNYKIINMSSENLKKILKI